MEARAQHGLLNRYQRWMKQVKLSRKLATALGITLLLSVTGTFFVIARTSSDIDPKLVLTLVIINLTLLLALIAVIARRAVGLLAGLKQGSVGSRMQTRIVVMFSLIAILPTLIISVFSALFFNYGIQSWFDERVSTGLEESVAVAEAYLAEHKETLRNDALAMARDIEPEWHTAIANPQRFNKIVNVQANLRSITEAVVFQKSRILGQTQLSFALAFEQVPQNLIERAASGEIVIFTDEDEDKVRALVKVNTLPDTYLLAGRLIDSKVVNHMENAQGSVNEYRRLKSQISDLQIQFSVVFVVVAVLLLVASIWYGMNFAAKLVGPIARLVNATERVRAGDFSTRVGEGPENDEIASLGRAFNRMTGQLENQRQELIDANRVIDERRRFSEAVLAGVSAGVVATNAQHIISLYNRFAASLFAEGDESLSGKNIAALMPQIASLLEEASKKPDRLTQGNITFTRGDKTLALHLRITTEQMGNIIEGYIITFDDISELVGAQRRAAWADVARRIAHEIKNPLTPIQLAAERLRKKYFPQIKEESENYIKYVDTISKHVGDIGKMVDEFVSFARMPTPVFKQEDLAGIIRKALFSEEVAHPDVSYSFTITPATITLVCDERQVTQLLINLLKNAAEAVESKQGALGTIAISAYEKDNQVLIDIRDNGPGFPPELMSTIMEPYVTTRARGTGLGLAIVKKSMEDHKGTIGLTNLDGGGACVTLSFSKDIEITAATV